MLVAECIDTVLDDQKLIRVCTLKYPDGNTADINAEDVYRALLNEQLYIVNLRADVKNGVLKRMFGKYPTLQAVNRLQQLMVETVYIYANTDKINVKQIGISADHSTFTARMFIYTPWSIQLIPQVTPDWRAITLGVWNSDYILRKIVERGGAIVGVEATCSVDMTSKNRDISARFNIGFDSVNASLNKVQGRTVKDLVINSINTSSVDQTYYQVQKFLEECGNTVKSLGK